MTEGIILFTLVKSFHLLELHIIPTEGNFTNIFKFSYWLFTNDDLIDYGMHSLYNVMIWWLKKLKHENLRKCSVTKQKSALKKKVHCAVYQRKLFLLEIIYFLVLIGSKDILDPD